MNSQLTLASSLSATAGEDYQGNESLMHSSSSSTDIPTTTTAGNSSSSSVSTSLTRSLSSQRRSRFDMSPGSGAGGKMNCIALH